MPDTTHEEAMINIVKLFKEFELLDNKVQTFRNTILLGGKYKAAVNVGSQHKGYNLFDDKDIKMPELAETVLKTAYEKLMEKHTMLRIRIEQLGFSLEELEESL